MMLRLLSMSLLSLGIVSNVAPHVSTPEQDDGNSSAAPAAEIEIDSDEADWEKVV
jgi:hypothetical protein